MKKQKKSILVLAVISFFTVTLVSLGAVSAVGGESDKPEQSKMLPANDGEPDGCNSSRFECVLGGEAVLDKQTGLTWARNTKIAAGPKPWQEAVEFCRNLVIGNQKGWRLPTKAEWAGLLDLSMSGPCLPDGHPFENVQASEITRYWSSTAYESDSSSAWTAAWPYCRMEDNLKIFDSHIWPVLGGK